MLFQVILPHSLQRVILLNQQLLVYEKHKLLRFITNILYIQSECFWSDS